MIVWNKNRPTVKPRAEYPISQILRACRKAVGLEASNSEGQMLSSKPRVLFVEDDADTRELVWYALTRANYEVQLAENAAQGVLRAMSEFFDLYMIDNWMPGASGIDLCIRLRKLDAHTPILFFSGAAYENDKREAVAAGAQGYLTKPAAIDDLLAEVSRLISQARPLSVSSQVLAVA